MGASELATGAVSATADIGDGIVTDAKLASPNNSTYKTIFHSQGALGSGMGAAARIYMLGTHGGQTSGSTAGDVMNYTGYGGGNLEFAADHLDLFPEVFYFDDADYTVAGLTQKLRLRCQILANATAPAITYTFGLYPVSVAGGSNILNITFGSVVASSTSAIVSPSASTVTSAVNSDFTVPSDGGYALGVVTSGAMATNSAVLCAAQLQTRNV